MKRFICICGTDRPKTIIVVLFLPPIPYCYFTNLDALAACRYIPQAKDRIFKILFSALNNSVPELQEAGAKCMEKVSHRLHEFLGENGGGGVAGKVLCYKWIQYQ